MGLKNRRKTYPLCNRRQKIGSGSVMSFCLIFGDWETLEASPMLRLIFEHQTKGFKLSSVFKLLLNTNDFHVIVQRNTSMPFFWYSNHEYQIS
jgi:hypothetical protein